LNAKHFTPLNPEDLDTSDDNNGMVIYTAAKAMADKKLWEIAHQHPDVDLTIRKTAISFPPQHSY
jgi:hypothetical protein